MHIYQLLNFKDVFIISDFDLFFNLIIELYNNIAEIGC